VVGASSSEGFLTRREICIQNSRSVSSEFQRGWVGVPPF